MRAIGAVLFDFDHTLFAFDDSVNWLRAAKADLGRGDDGTRELYDRIEAARTWPEVLAEQQGCQRSAVTHRKAVISWFRRAGADADLADALYRKLVIPDGWAQYRDAAHVLKTLRSWRVPVAVVSNVGWDIRPTFAWHGFGDLVDTFVLSCEVGAEKPDVTLFRIACTELGVPPEEALMVGDDPVNDGAAVRVGLRVYLMPDQPRGERRGLGRIFGLLSESEETCLPVPQ